MTLSCEEFLQASNQTDAITIWIPNNYFPETITVERVPGACKDDNDRVGLDLKFKSRINVGSELLDAEGKFKLCWSRYFYNVQYLATADDLYTKPWEYDGAIVQDHGLTKFALPIYIPLNFRLKFAMLKEMNQEGVYHFKNGNFNGKTSFHGFALKRVRTTADAKTGPDTSIETNSVHTESELCGSLPLPLQPVTWGIETRCSRCGTDICE